MMDEYKYDFEDEEKSEWHKINGGLASDRYHYARDWVAPLSDLSEMYQIFPNDEQNTGVVGASYARYGLELLGDLSDKSKTQKTKILVVLMKNPSFATKAVADSTTSMLNKVDTTYDRIICINILPIVATHIQCIVGHAYSKSSDEGEYRLQRLDESNHNYIGSLEAISEEYRSIVNVTKDPEQMKDILCSNLEFIESVLTELKKRSNKNFEFDILIGTGSLKSGSFKYGGGAQISERHSEKTDERELLAQIRVSYVRILEKVFESGSNDVLVFKSGNKGSGFGRHPSVSNGELVSARLGEDAVSYRKDDKDGKDNTEEINSEIKKNGNLTWD